MLVLAFASAVWLIGVILVALASLSLVVHGLFVRPMQERNVALVKENTRRQQEVDDLRESERVSREQVQTLLQSLGALATQALAALGPQAATLEERNRAAGDVHDALAQGFTAIVVQLQAAEDAKAKGLPDDAAAHLQIAHDLARESLKEARNSVRALRPQMFRSGLSGPVIPRGWTE